jgi:DNA-directed RNA polymerase subunit omega
VLMKTRIDDLLLWIDNSRFGLAISAAKRARQINNYFRHLGEGLGQEAGPQIRSASNKSLTLALEEIAADKLEFELPDEGVK